MGQTQDLKSAAPSALLPPLASAIAGDGDDLLRVFARLRSIYSPPIQGFAHSSQSNASNNWSLQDDAFERTHTVKWLTGFIARFSELEENDDENDLVREAASILAMCSGSSAQGAVSRSFRFGNFEVFLNDAPLDSDASGSSVGLQTWGSSYVLAQKLVDDPSLYRHPANGRLLELGAGTGLVSLVLAQLRPDPIVVSTDCHSGVLENLRANVARNGLSHRVDVRELDWSTFVLEHSRDVPVDWGTFDHIFAADVVYEAEQCAWLSACVNALLQKPHGVFHLVVPVRKTHAREAELVEAAFPLDDATLAATATPRLVSRFKEDVLPDQSAEGAIAQTTTFRHYTIGWSR